MHQAAHIHGPAHTSTCTHSSFILHEYCWLQFFSSKAAEEALLATHRRDMHRHKLHSAQWGNNLPFKSWSQSVLGCIPSTYVSRCEGKMEPLQNQDQVRPAWVIQRYSQSSITPKLTWIHILNFHSLLHPGTYLHLNIGNSAQTPAAIHSLPHTPFHRQKLRKKFPSLHSLLPRSQK